VKKLQYLVKKNWDSYAATNKLTHNRNTVKDQTISWIPDLDKDPSSLCFSRPPAEKG
jgi:hypothetical protein